MKNFEEFAKDIARRAGEVMMDNFSLEVEKNWKEDNSPVTETDLKVNKMLIEEVRKNYPDHSVLAEEESDLLDGSEYVWVCDPVDGTMPFSHAMPLFTFSLALVQNGQPILGVIYDPVLDRMFFAEKGKGAFLNDEKISVSENSDLKNAVLNVDGSGKDVGLDQLDVLRTLKKKGAHALKLYSVIYGGMLTAAGQFSGTIFLKSTAHDTAAIKILVEEAGGKVTDVDGNDQRYDKKCNGMIASNGLLHDELVEIVNKN